MMKHIFTKTIYPLMFFLIISIGAIFCDFLSCDYNLNLKIDNVIYDGSCHLGSFSFIESEDNNNTSIWHVHGLAFSTFEQMYFFVISRDNLRYHLDSLYLYNINMKDFKFLSYGYERISNKEVVLFQEFPIEHAYVAKVEGKINIFDMK